MAKITPSWYQVTATFIRTVANGIGIRLYGATSGYIGIKPPATVTSWDLTMPSAAPAADSSYFIVNQDGTSSFTTGTGGTGPQGFQGFQGNQGATGAGFQGYQGNQGSAGSSGSAGTQGGQGWQGSAGSSGTSGNQGFQGSQGAAGTGAQGAQGAAGSAGSAGVQGFQGFQGNQGNQGATGTTGTTGLQGFQGFQGRQGFQGAAGPQGFQGFQGLQGGQGFQGAAGTGAQGFQGLQGNQGRQGLIGPGDVAVEYTINGNGSAITTGVKGDLEIPFAFTITGWTLMADQSGSIVIDVWKDTYANFPPTVADTIAGSEKPTLSSAAKNQDLTLSTWTTSVSAGDILRFNVDSITTCTRVTLAIRGTRP